MSSPFPQIVNDPDLIIETPPESEEEEVVEVVRENINTDDIFEKAEAPAPAEPVVQPIKEEKPKKKRKPMSEEHKAKLKLAREKAMAMKKQKAQERKEIKDLESKAEVKKKEKKKKELEDIVNDVPPPRPKADIDPSIIEKAIPEALEKNEMLRARRKAQKKKEKDEEIERAKAQEEIRKAIYPPKLYYGDNGFFASNVYGLK